MPSITVHSYDAATGAYIGDTTAFADPLTPGEYLIPANATTVAPPVPGANQVPVWANGAWTLEADYRGWKGFDANGTPVEIGAIGQSPQTGWTTTPSPPTPAQQWAAYQADAAAALNRSDTTMHRVAEGVTLGKTSWTAADVVAWVQWRQALRAILAAAQPATIPAALPAQPAYPAGT